MNLKYLLMIVLFLLNFMHFSLAQGSYQITPQNYSAVALEIADDYQGRMLIAESDLSIHLGEVINTAPFDPQCQAPTNISITINQDDVTLSWDDLGPGAVFEVYYKNLETNVEDRFVVNQSNAIIYNLPDGLYSFSVVNICQTPMTESAGPGSIIVIDKPVLFVLPPSFSTTCDCLEPNPVAMAFLSGGTFTMDWVPQIGRSYLIESTFINNIPKSGLRVDAIPGYPGYPTRFNIVCMENLNIGNSLYDNTFNAPDPESFLKEHLGRKQNGTFQWNMEGAVGLVDEIIIYDCGFTAGEGESKTESRLVKNASAELMIYPNPVQNELQFNWSSNEAEEGLLSIFDLYGKLIYQSDIQKGKNNISLFDWANGAYFIQVATAKNTQQETFLIQRH